MIKEVHSEVKEMEAAPAASLAETTPTTPPPWRRRAVAGQAARVLLLIPVFSIKHVSRVVLWLLAAHCRPLIVSSVS